MRETLNKLDYLVMLLLGLTLLDKVNLVLHYDNMFQFHYLDGCQVLRGLRLWARLVAGCTWTTSSTVIVITTNQNLKTQHFSLKQPKLKLLQNTNKKMKLFSGSGNCESTSKHNAAQLHKLSHPITGAHYNVLKSKTVRFNIYL